MNQMGPAFKLVRDFILPSLDCETYGRHLQWENKNKGSFRISRIHQNSEHWSEDCVKVYKAWSTKKQLWKTNDPKRITKAKHRLVTALRRNPEIQMLEKESKYYRFQLLESIAQKKNYETNVDYGASEKAIPQQNEESVPIHKLIDDGSLNTSDYKQNIDKTQRVDLIEDVWIGVQDIISNDLSSMLECDDLFPNFDFKESHLVGNDCYSNDLSGDSLLFCTYKEMHP